MMTVINVYTVSSSHVRPYLDVGVEGARSIYVQYNNVNVMRFNSL